MGNAIQFRADFGVPGDVSRKDQQHIDGAALDSALPFASFGIPGKNSSGKFVPIAGTTDVVNGFLVRPYPFTGANASDPLGTAVPPTTGVANRLKRGYITVKNNAGTPANDGQVYVRGANASTGKPISGIEAALETAAASAAKSGGNTGNGTLVLDVTTPVLANALAGVYTVRCIEAVTNGGKFEVKDPTGKAVGMAIIVAGAGGTYTFSDQIKFVLTDGSTDFIVGDGFDVTVTFNTAPIPNCLFTGPADANNNVEVAYNI